MYVKTSQLSLKTALLGSLLLMTACAHVQTSSKRGEGTDVPAPKTLTEVLRQDISTPQGADSPSRISVENGKVVVQGFQLKNTQFDIPITVNSRVEYWIDYFCGRGRRFFEKYLDRSKFFVPYIVPILKKNGLPEDLVYLAMIESGFNNFARSRARAVGPWQFISATGKRYGLSVNWWVDERREIDKSTQAAAEYLKDLYNMFQGWELAAAAYNAGEAKVARAIRRFGTKDFWVIARHRFLRQETRDYVPKIIAAAIISKNRSQFGFVEPEGNAPAPDEAVASDGEIVKVIKTDKPVEDAQYQQEKAADMKSAEFALDEESNDDNSGITSAALTLPADTSEGNNDKDVAPPPLAKPIPTPHITKTGEVGGEQLVEFEVQSPADLLKISRAAGLSYLTVKSLNPEVLRWCTPPNVGTYRIRLPSSTKEKFLSTYNHEAFPRKVQFMTYKVRKGETLSRIARHFGIKVDPISDLNGVSPKTPLRHGLKVLLPMPNDRSRTFAQLEVRDPPERHRVRRHRKTPGKYYKLTYKQRREAARSSFSRNRDG